MTEHRQLTPFEELGPTRHLTSFEQPTPKLPDAETVKVIAELGLRYRPSSATDLEAHAAMIALLTKDVAHVPVRYLRMAADKWARENKWMPKAAELIELARSLRPKPSPAESPESEAARRNATLAPDSRMHWVVEHGDVRLVPRSYRPPREDELCRPEEASAILAEIGLKFGRAA